MKKLLVVILLLVSINFFYSAENIGSMIGFNIGYNINSITASGSGITIDYIDLNSYSIGLFLDLVYLRGSIIYNDSIGPIKFLGSTALKLKITFFDLDLILKYPFEIGTSIVLWPAAGILSSVILSHSFEMPGPGDTFKEDMSDIYLKLGGGTDIFVFENMAITLSIFYALNLKPGPNDIPSGVNFSGHIVQFNIGIGFKL